MMTEREKAFFLNGVSFLGAAFAEGEHDAMCLALESRICDALKIPWATIREVVAEIHSELDAGGFRDPSKPKIPRR